MWAKGTESLQKRFHLWGPQHHLSLPAQRSHTRWITHHRWHHHHRPHCEYSSSSSFLSYQSPHCHLLYNVWSCDSHVPSESRLLSGSVIGCVSTVSARRPLWGTYTFHACTRSWGASCLDVVSANHWPTWPSSAWDGCDRTSCQCAALPMHHSTAHLGPTLKQWLVASLTTS